MVYQLRQGDQRDIPLQFSPMLSDIQLVQTFVEDSLRARETLLANKSLIAECRFGSNQLMGKQTGLLAKVNIKTQPVQFWVRPNTSYQALLDELLQRNQFVAGGKPDKEGFVSYGYTPAKAGYTLNQQPARALWRNWRTLYRMQENLAKAEKLLIQNGEDWEAIQKITMSNQMMFIETASGETVSHMDDAISWLSESNPAEPVAKPGLPKNPRVPSHHRDRVQNAADNGGFPDDAF
ncbi:MAG: hypothetical protein AAFU71_14155 [Cyanobacteria bacterium J06632_22]